MTDTFAGIIAKIKTKLESLKDDDENDLFGKVVDFRDGEFSDFPVAMIYEIGWRGEVIDTHRNERTFSIGIDLYQEQSRAGKTKAEAVEIMRDIVDRVIVSFDQDPDLSGEVEIINVVSGTTDFRISKGTFNFANFVIEARVIVSNYSV